jgi:hypothetical protein
MLTGTKYRTYADAAVRQLSTHAVCTSHSVLLLRDRAAAVTHSRPTFDSKIVRGSRRQYFVTLLLDKHKDVTLARLFAAGDVHCAASQHVSRCSKR